VTQNDWTRWPSREALGHAGLTTARRVLGIAVRLLISGIIFWGIVGGNGVHGWRTVGVAAAVVVAAGAAWAFARTTLDHRLLAALAFFAALYGVAVLATLTGFHVPALVIWCACTVVAMERLPLVAGLPAAAVSLAGYAVVNDDAWLTTTATAVGLVLAGYVVRLDSEARGSAQRLLVQERAARKAEAESAALAERARIAREIHDVLAHSLSAQLVHLEAARLLIEGGADRQQILDRVVAARGMARDGLSETRQALSALRGDMTPLEDFLAQLADGTGNAGVAVSGDRRPLSAEASQAVRRVAQEAVTNIRKHAPGARVEMSLEYGGAEVTLHVRDFGGRPGELSVTGGGYGLLGMRERAELLGGSLDARPVEEGFAVTLKVPA
jgi:signal transduction histidine kinase